MSYEIDPIPICRKYLRAVEKYVSLEHISTMLILIRSIYDQFIKPQRKMNKNMSTNGTLYGCLNEVNIIHS